MTILLERLAKTAQHAFGDLQKAHPEAIAKALGGGMTKMLTGTFVRCEKQGIRFLTAAEKQLPHLVESAEHVTIHSANMALVERLAKGEKLAAPEVQKAMKTIEDIADLSAQSHFTQDWGHRLQADVLNHKLHHGIDCPVPLGHVPSMKGDGARVFHLRDATATAMRELHSVDQLASHAAVFDEARGLHKGIRDALLDPTCVARPMDADARGHLMGAAKKLIDSPVAQGSLKHGGLDGATDMLKPLEDAYSANKSGRLLWKRADGREFIVGGG